MNKYTILGFSLLFFLSAKAQKNAVYTEKSIVLNNGARIFGTLTLPKNKSDTLNLVLFIAGSGPTDRNGNSGVTIQPASTQKLAYALASAGIASVRYDKRMIGESKDSKTKEKDLTFNTYIEDAVEWIRKLKASGKYHKIIVAGHSEGSLIGMRATEIAGADAFISLAGAGRTIDLILTEQLKKQPLLVQEEAAKIIPKIKAGETVTDVNPLLASLFRPGIQPYLRSWFALDPAVEIAKLKVPILIINGTTDVQVPVSEAEILHKAVPNSKLVLIEGMNHIFKTAPEEYVENIKTYFDPNLPLNPKLAPEMIQFIKSLK